MERLHSFGRQMSQEADLKQESRKKRDVVTIIGIVLTLLVFLFGDNIYEQVTGRSFFVQPSEATNTPVFTGEADSTLHDDFDNLAFNGSFDSNLWRCRNCGPNAVTQNDGVLMATRDRQPDQTVGLFAKRFDSVTVQTLTSDAPTFFETKLKLDPGKHTGNVQLQLYVVGIPGDDRSWFSQCTLGAVATEERAWSGCTDTYESGPERHNYTVEASRVDFGTWHTVRIELDPASMIFSYFVDGEKIGSHIPIDAELIREARFFVSVSVHGSEVVGYFDYVRVGQIK